MKKRISSYLSLLFLFVMAIGIGQILPQKVEAARTVSQTKKQIKKLNEEIENLENQLILAKEAKYAENKENKKKTKGCKDVLFATVVSTSPFIVYADYVIGENGYFLIKGGSANWGSTYSGSFKLTGKTGVWEGHTYQEATAVSTNYKSSAKVSTLKKRIKNKKRQLKKLKGDIILQPSLNKDTVYLYVKNYKNLGWSINTSYHTFSKSKSVMWESSDPSIVTVKNGEIRALQCGTVTITVTGRISGKKDTVTVVSAPLPYLQASVDSIEMEVGETKEVSVELIYPEELKCPTKEIHAEINKGRCIGFEVDYQDELSKIVEGHKSLTLTITARNAGEDKIVISVIDYYSSMSMSIKDLKLPVIVHGDNTIEGSEITEPDNIITDEDNYYNEENDDDYYNDDYYYDTDYYEGY